MICLLLLDPVCRLLIFEPPFSPIPHSTNEDDAPWVTDTTASVFTNLAYELCRNAHVQNTLYSELKRHFSSTSEINAASTKPLQYLDAVVQEALRLWPPNSAGTESRLGPNGATIAGQYVPPYTNVRVVQLALMSDERYFTRPGKFAPERWLDDGEYLQLLGGATIEGEEERPRVLDRRAWIPFSMYLLLYTSYPRGGIWFW